MGLKTPKRYHHRFFHSIGTEQNTHLFNTIQTGAIVVSGSFIDISIINLYVDVSRTGTYAEYRLVAFVRYINQRATATVLSIIFATSKLFEIKCWVIQSLRGISVFITNR